MQGHRPALRETREDDAGSGNADRELPVEIAAHNLFGRAYAGVVLGIAGAEADDVVPGAHRHAAVGRHRDRKRRGWGKVWSVRVVMGVRRDLKSKKEQDTLKHNKLMN